MRLLCCFVVLKIVKVESTWFAGSDGRDGAGGGRHRHHHHRRGLQATLQAVAMPPRSTIKSFVASKKREGAGFIIRRSIGSSSVSTKETDPFLMLDELPVTNYKPGEFPGAPMHPHRGMDTVMYCKQGTLGHKDSMGNSGILRDGDCKRSLHTHLFILKLTHANPLICRPMDDGRERHRAR